MNGAPLSDDAWAILRAPIADIQIRDNRVVESLYHQAIAGNPTCIIFWLKNRRPSEWRDVQHLDQAVGHYILSDKPMTEQEWITARADRAKPVQQAVTQQASHEVTNTEDDTAKPLD